MSGSVEERQMMEGMGEKTTRQILVKKLEAQPAQAIRGKQTHEKFDRVQRNRGETQLEKLTNASNSWQTIKTVWDLIRRSWCPDSQTLAAKIHFSVTFQQERSVLLCKCARKRRGEE